MKFKHILFLLLLVSGINHSFAQNISFPTLFSSVTENAGGINITLAISAAPTTAATVEVFVATGGSAANTDFVFSTQTITFPAGSTANQTIRVNVNDNTNPQPARFIVLEIRNPINAALTTTLANRQHILHILDDDLKAPQATQSLKMEFVSSFLVGTTPANTAEIVTYDKVSKRLFVVNSGADKLEILDFNNPANIRRIRTIDMTAYGNGSQSVAVRNGIVAVAVDVNAPWGSDGKAVFFNTNGDFISQVMVGNLPDMITFSPDGRWVMTANEGEPNDAYTIDPEGSISMIDISAGVANLAQSSVTTLNFNAFNGQIATLRASGVRIYGGLPAQPSNVSQDLEPEYITISADSRKAWVTLQEANAIAVVDMVSKRITDILPLGLKDHTIPSNSFDAVDLGGGNAGLPVVFSNWKVKGMYQPDAIAYYEVGGTPYLVTANEGDSRNYPRADAPPRTFNEEVRVGAAGYVLDLTAFPNASILKRNHVLGRLTVTNQTGDTDGDGDFDEIHVLGGRSFSIWNANTGALVFDSGNQFELITASNPIFGTLFNASHDNNELKNRSDNKGPEPEGVTIIKTAYNVYAFIALERIGGVMVYEISNPAAPVYVDYINSRAVAALGGDRGAEGIIFIPAEESPNGADLVLTANEISATVAVYGVKGIERALFSPNSLTANAGSQAVTLSWTAVRGASSYEIYVYSANSPQRLIGTVADNSFIAKDLQNGVTYFFKIIAVSASGNKSDFSNEVSARPSVVLGIEEEVANALFQVYPNPSNGSFSLQINDLKGKNAEISVLDLGGRVLYRQSLQVNGRLDTQINLNLASGLYLLQLQTEKDNLKRKLVIER